MDVLLTPELEKLIQAKVESGRYTSPSEVVGEALRLLDEQDSEREKDLDELHARMDEALAAADRGDFVNGEEFMQAMLDDMDLQEARRKAG